jgi:ABC-type nickel/cobalt efflux system permease component RcnA
MPLLLLLLGLLVAAASAAFVGLLIAYNTSGGPDYTVNLLGEHPFTMSTLGTFAAGLGLALIFALGLWAMARGGMMARRGKGRHATHRYEGRRVASERDIMARRVHDTGHEERIPVEPVHGEQHTGSTSYESQKRRPAMAFHRPHMRGH